MNKKSRNQIQVQCAITAISTVALIVGFNTTEAFANGADYRFLIDSDWQNCQQISPTYREVYAFETKSFYINICQQDNLYFYSGEAKQSDLSSVFLPAYPLKDHRGFEAENGNVSYVVVLPFSDRNFAPDLPEEAILTIKRNGRLVSVESSLNKYCQRLPIAIAPAEIEPNLDNSDRLATIPLQQDIAWNSLEIEPINIQSMKVFDPNSRFDFYRLDGKIHRLTTCN